MICATLTWFCNLVLPLLVSIPTGIATGLFSSYWIARHFEFKGITSRAVYALRKFPKDASHCIEELTMCQHHLESQSFHSGWSSLQEIIDWATRNQTDPSPEPPGKRDIYMPMLELLRPTFRECLPFSKK